MRRFPIIPEAEWRPALLVAMAERGGLLVGEPVAHGYRWNEKRPTPDEPVPSDSLCVDQQERTIIWGSFRQWGHA